MLKSSFQALAGPGRTVRRVYTGTSALSGRCLQYPCWPHIGTCGWCPCHRHHRLWVHPRTFLPVSKGSLSKWFVDLVVASRRHHGLFDPVSIGPHQMRKLGASYSSFLGQDEDAVVCVMGFSSKRIFKKNYVAWVPPLHVPCMLPGGPFLARKDHELSTSD